MTYERFEDLPVWQKAIELGERSFLLVEDHAFDRRGDLRDQMQRAATSVSNNIAEGFERGSTAELIYYIYVARGSAGEVRSMFHLCDRLPFFGHLQSEISNLRSIAESCSRQLRGWADSLQNSDVKGQKFLTEDVRRRQRADRFLEELRSKYPRPWGSQRNATPPA